MAKRCLSTVSTCLFLISTGSNIDPTFFFFTLRENGPYGLVEISNYLICMCHQESSNVCCLPGCLGTLINVFTISQSCFLRHLTCPWIMSLTTDSHTYSLAFASIQLRNVGGEFYDFMGKKITIYSVLLICFYYLRVAHFLDLRWSFHIG